MATRVNADGSTTEVPDGTPKYETNADPNRDRLQQWYQQYLGRAASDQEMDTWLRDHPDLSGVEESIRSSQEAQARGVPQASGAQGTPTSPATQTARVNQWYQQYMGRAASDAEIQSWIRDHGIELTGVEEGIRTSAEAQAYATKAGKAPGAAGGTGTPGYDVNKLREALLASGGAASPAALKAFIAAHPEFATGVTIGGSKGNKLYGPGGVFLADVIQGTSGPNPTWAWDTSIGGGMASGGAGSPTPIDPSYLAGYPGESFTAPPGSELPGPFSYEDFVAPGAFHQPTAEDVYNDPSYQFRKDQAMGALANSASGKGLTNSGGTIYDLLGTASQFASQEYGNIWDRGFKDWQTKYDTALNTYATNRGNAADIYGTKDTSAKNIYGRARDEFDSNVKDYYDNRNSAFDKLYKMTALGANVTTAP